MEVLINTARGQKTPRECLDLFSTGQLDTGATTGILKQLMEKAPVEARELASKITSISNCTAKLRRLATDCLNGVQAPRYLRTENDVIAVMSKLQRGNRIKISFKKQLSARTFQTAFALGILAMHNKGLINLDGPGVRGLAMLIQANAWTAILHSGHLKATVQQNLTEDSIRPVAKHIAKCVGRVELVRVQSRYLYCR